MKSHGNSDLPSLWTAAPAFREIPAIATSIHINVVMDHLQRSHREMPHHCRAIMSDGYRKYRA